MISRPLKLGFLASGNGSSAETMVNAIAAGALAARACLVVSNKRTAPALAWAEARGVPALAIPTIGDPDTADQTLADAMTAHGVELIVLSGYLRRLGPVTLSRYAGRIVNIHPGPLPRFGGDGMYGARVHQAVLAAGLTESAIVIHLVDEEYDHGPELARRAVPVSANDTPETLEARVKAAEPAFFVETLQRIATGELELPT
ncbi:MAG: phosphoribosylglycinamide formyltransferase [Alphaproteobacteria bacterium]|nr:phosphoribosylglycinamide formyltransferase [Alphaproteobacteria bacterium]MBU1513722.1 phosphoribosylglycinamide formyltransferase [Alphaproteobacteria bacterium]MBU2094633.1 phosphoribosylglycinamide formyltransferase [Alphaproteobacteria bacterium]MBU2150298.1 phosphoribosylglycinamide formyltransferase [Alphaproteobacteria bacterium]MBU2309173.1 phosphoribosylglycinamide formyltransferase [Alphaproteobacteria bacterium]